MAEEKKRKRASSDGENARPNGVRRSSRERKDVVRYVPVDGEDGPVRFHITPKNEWGWLVKKMKMSVRNALEWRTGLPLPTAPGSCWLLPCKDDTAVEIGRHRKELAKCGWKLLTCPPEVVARIGNKANLVKYAAELGLLEHLPQHYASPERASYPCMLKATAGEHGRDVFIVESRKDVKAKAHGGFHPSRWLLQELCAGHIEHATSLLVKDGAILDAICTNYVYDKEVYVWPFVEEEESKRRSHEEIPEAHLEVMRAFVVGFSGVCNFNYKVRPDGGMCIFECNARVGADLACDVPRRRAAAFFSRLDGLEPTRA